MTKRLDGVSDRIMRSIENDTVWVDLARDGDRSRVVDFSNGASTYAYNTVFEGTRQQSMPSKTQIVALFPHQTKRNQVLYSSRYGSTAAFSDEMQKRLGGNPAETQLVLCWSDFFYVVKGVTGNLYLIWSSHLSIYMEDDSEIQQMGDTGFLVHTDGHHKALLWYPLFVPHQNQAVFMINPGMMRLIHPPMPLYNRDTRRELMLPGSIERLTAYDAKTRKERAQIPDHEKVDFARHKDMYVRAAPPGSLYGSSDASQFTTTDAEDDEVARGGGSGDDFNNNNDDPDEDAVMAFLGGTLEKKGPPVRTPEESAYEDVAHRRTAKSVSAASAAAAAAVVSDDEGSSDMLPYNTPTARIAYRHRVPRGLVPREEHRTSRHRVAYVPRALPTAPPSGSADSDTSADSSPLPASRRPSMARPSRVPVLPLGNE